MGDLVQIPETSLVRDVHSKALLNTDRTGLQEYYMKREIAKRQNTAHIETKQRLDVIENEMQEIKTLLRELLQVRGS